MGSKGVASIALLVSLNLLFFSMVSAQIDVGVCVVIVGDVGFGSNEVQIASPPSPSTKPSPPPPPPSTKPSPPPPSTKPPPPPSTKPSPPPPSPSTKACCSVLAGLSDLVAAKELCVAIRANVLGINVNFQEHVELIFNACGRTVPKGFQC